MIGNNVPDELCHEVDIVIFTAQLRGAKKISPQNRFPFLWTSWQRFSRRLQNVQFH
jgi:hypothetical protein